MLCTKSLGNFPTFHYHGDWGAGAAAAALLPVRLQSQRSWGLSVPVVQRGAQALLRVWREGEKPSL